MDDPYEVAIDDALSVVQEEMKKLHTLAREFHERGYVLLSDGLSTIPIQAWESLYYCQEQLLLTVNRKIEKLKERTKNGED